VVAVCALHHYCGTQSNGTGAVVGKALVRILRNAREIQYVVLKAIVEMAKDRPQLFVPFLSDFFVKSSDPLFCRALKLEVLTMLTEAANVQQVKAERRRLNVLRGKQATFFEHRARFSWQPSARAPILTPPHRHRLPGSLSLSLFLSLSLPFFWRCRSCGSSSRTWATPRRRLWCKW
jgi:hypothetical protein